MVSHLDFALPDVVVASPSLSRSVKPCPEMERGSHHLLCSGIESLAVWPLCTVHFTSIPADCLEGLVSMGVGAQRYRSVLKMECYLHHGLGLYCLFI